MAIRIESVRSTAFATRVPNNEGKYAKMVKIENVELIEQMNG